jgi:hypothetical protein
MAMTFAIIGIAIVAPFGFMIALVLSMESSRERQMEEIRRIGRDFDTYLDGITKKNDEIRKRYGFTVSHTDADHLRKHCCGDDPMACTKR